MKERERLLHVSEEPGVTDGLFAPDRTLRDAHGDTMVDDGSLYCRRIQRRASILSGRDAVVE